MEENTPRKTESEVLEHCLPQSEVDKMLAYYSGLPPDAPVALIQERFNLAFLDELLYENFGIRDREKANMKQIGKCLKQINELDQIITDGRTKNL